MTRLTGWPVRSRRVPLAVAPPLAVRENGKIYQNARKVVTTARGPTSGRPECGPRTRTLSFLRSARMSLVGFMSSRTPTDRKFRAGVDQAADDAAWDGFAACMARTNSPAPVPHFENTLSATVNGTSTGCTRSGGRM
jgi:hypothetical protein